MDCSDISDETPNPASPQTLRVDFHLDLICPWCWIGLRNLRSAWATVRQAHPGLVLETVWHANVLLPQIPAQGVPYQAFYEARLGGQRAVAMRRAQIRAVAEAVGLSLNFETIVTFPNSALACALVNAAQSKLGPEAMYQLVESVYCAFFSQGRDIGSAETLQALAQAVAFSWNAGEAAQPGSSMEDEQTGGVPHFVFNRRWPVTGAVPAGELVRIMQQAAVARRQENECKSDG